MDNESERPIPKVIDSRNISQDRLKPNIINSGELLSQERQDEAREQEKALRRFNFMSLAARVTVTLAILSGIAGGAYEANQLISDAIPSHNSFSTKIDQFNATQVTPNPQEANKIEASRYDNEAKRWIADKYYNGKVTIDLDSELKFRGGPVKYAGNEVANSRIVKINGYDVSEFSSFTVNKPEILTNEKGEKYLVLRNSDIYTGLNADGKTKHYDEKDTFVFVGPETADYIHFLNGNYQSNQKNIQPEDVKAYGIVIDGVNKSPTPTPTR
ncbi:MAG TPA: hypothetical protein VG917_01915 [Patescibacteria group bacterium]|nr:hypothetical protein [Patescibacteria group bacterium]